MPGLATQRQMTTAADPQELRALVALLVEIGDLRVQLCGAQAKILRSSSISAIDEGAEAILDAARSCERDLAAMGAALLRRADADGAAILHQPLNKYEEAHLDMARKTVEQIDCCCRRPHA